MKLKIALATATALGLCMGTAWADDNANHNAQIGDYNSYHANQTAGGSNIVGTVSDPVLQHGNNNDINIDQADGSTLGDPGTSSSNANGVDQIDDYNVLIVDQKHGKIQQVQQTGVSTATAATNILSITQTDNVGTTTSKSNIVTSVSQTYTGTTGGADQNSVIINQSLTSPTVNPGHFNNVSTVTQDGNRDSISIDQKTGWNTVASVSQTNGTHNIATISQGTAIGGSHNYTTSVTQNGSENLVVLHLNGSENGSGGLSGPGRVASGNHSASFTQGGDSNQASLTADGDSNQYAVKQQGNRNIATGLSMSGDSNGLGIGQYIGDDNLVTLADISGNFNQVGLRQDGNGNVITGLGFGSSGYVDILQGGNDNDATFNQMGDSNSIIVGIDGDRNHLNMAQNNTGVTGNNINVSITGDDNNNYPVSPPLSGDALAARDVVRGDLGSSTFGQGSLLQNGSNNSLTMTVLASNANAFATYQQGDDNSITHTISSGNANQAVISQIGTGNTSNSSQSGSGNIVGITQ